LPWAPGPSCTFLICLPVSMHLCRVWPLFSARTRYPLPKGGNAETFFYFFAPAWTRGDLGFGRVGLWINGLQPNSPRAQASPRPSGHASKWSLTQVVTHPNGHNPKWSHTQMVTTPTGPKPNWSQTQLVQTPTGPKHRVSKTQLVRNPSNPKPKVSKP